MIVAQQLLDESPCLFGPAMECAMTHTVYSRLALHGNKRSPLAKIGPAIESPIVEIPFDHRC